VAFIAGYTLFINIAGIATIIIWVNVWCDCVFELMFTRFAWNFREWFVVIGSICVLLLL
jgi:hypothetical protein